jgi:hypothetical protein
MFIDQRILQLLVPGVLPALYPLTAPDGTLTPYTTYTLFNAQNLTTHDAPLPATRMWHMQFNTYSETYGQARTIGNNISNMLIGYTDPYILGVTPVREMPSWDDISKCFGWIVEVLITEQLSG